MTQTFVAVVHAYIKQQPQQILRGILAKKT